MKPISTFAFSNALLLALAASAPAAFVQFTYTQTDFTTGSGSIPSFVAGGHTFTLTSMPAATVWNPNPGATPAGFVGAQTLESGISNEANTAVGLLWSGTVTASSPDGFLIDIRLAFVPKQTQTPADQSDYTWNVVYGDSIANGVDTITPAAIRMAMWLSRDDVLNGAETDNTFQRYTQDNVTFTAGANSFTNTTTTTGAIKDAMDGGNPAGTDAVGRNLAFYFGWRDTSSITQGAILTDTFTVGGLLNADESTIRPVPEPGSALLLLAAAPLLLRRRRQ